MSNQHQRNCPCCGHEIPGAMRFCPICMLRKGLAGGVESGQSSLFEETIKLPAEQVARRYEHYELVKGEDGKPVELGRGAMGVTYKAVDVDLHRPVTLKVIKERYLGDESARLRFLREARAAASVRHANVASVFHLGRTGQNYFYAMEFVEGETLEHLIKHSGRLEVKLALEIATQVAAGLAAVHTQKLVHRDIKPSNIMVNVEEGSIVTAKIIDLGLAKPAPDSPPQAAISTPGTFVGTPEFASPEQFAGVGVDIRSDLYSLGVVLWKMLTGRVVFTGSPAKMMHQHQHSPLPLEQLEAVPQPVVVLVGALLEKDPARRFQTPVEVQKAILTITGAVEAGASVTCHSLREKSPAASRDVNSGSPARLGPQNISVARLPVTASRVFGREEDIAFLNDGWANQHVNVVTIVAWAGVGKSTLVNHWLGRLAAEHYRSAELVFGWSFYQQGSSGDTSSADEFLDAALTWFGDPDPRLGTSWEKGERLAKLIAYRRTLLILDGLEPLQNPPGPGEGRLREPCLQALVRELAAFNSGLCVITTRLPVADIGDHVHAAAPCRHLEHLSNHAGAQLLRALGVEGPEEELRRASDEFNGHCLALSLLGSYLVDAFKGDIRCRREMTGCLALDVREGTHARKVMASYEKWFGESPEVAVLYLLGLFDRPADEKAVEVLINGPVIPGLTEFLIDLSPSERQKIFSRLRRARLLAGTDPCHRGQLDTHPIVREHFGEQLRKQRSKAWKECNRRLYQYYRALAPSLPDNLKDMEPLFLAVICGCRAGLFHDALHQVYNPRIQRGNASFAAKVLGARGALLAILAHFFQPGRWGLPVQTEVTDQSLTEEDQLFVLTQAGMYLTATRGHSAPEARLCHQRVESLCASLDRPLLLYSALIGQWRHFLLTGQLRTAMQTAQRVSALAQELNNSALAVGACHALAGTLYYLSDFQSARRYARRGVRLWRSADKSSPAEEVSAPAVSCLCYQALCAWHFGQIASGRNTMRRAIALARELNDTHALAVALFHAAFLSHFERHPAEVVRLASDLLELATRQNFALWLTAGEVLLGWARGVSGSTAEGLSRIENGLRGYRAAGSMLNTSWALALKAECLHLAVRTPEALTAIEEAETIVESSGERWWQAELHRLRGVFLTEMDSDQAQIETSLGEAIRIAKEQKSISLEKRAKETSAEYQRQKASGSGGRGFRLPLC